MDLISREDAIRWVKTECNPYGKPTLDFESGKKVIEHLEQMPSAQPEQRWIPCSERLPREEDKVLCCTQTKAGAKNIVLGYYAGGKWRCGMNSNVVAWKPLPEAYGGE